jgi:hypothetical protein
MAFGLVAFASLFLISPYEEAHWRVTYGPETNLTRACVDRALEDDELQLRCGTCNASYLQGRGDGGPDLSVVRLHDSKTVELGYEWFTNQYDPADALRARARMAPTADRIASACGAAPGMWKATCVRSYFGRGPCPAELLP